MLAESTSHGGKEKAIHFLMIVNCFYLHTCGLIHFKLDSIIRKIRLEYTFYIILFGEKV